MKLKPFLVCALCVLLTAVITCSVVFLPRIYYSVSDNRSDFGKITETFSLDITNHNVSGEEYIKLIESGESLWIEKSGEIDYARISEIAQSALTGFLERQSDNELVETYTKDAINIIGENDPLLVQTYTARGTLGTVTTAVDLLYLRYSQIFEEENYSNMLTLLINTDNYTVYEMSLELYRSMKTGYISDAFSESADDAEYEIFGNLLKENLYSYWQIGTGHNIIGYVGEFSLNINICNQNFEDYCRNPLINGR